MKSVTRGTYDGKTSRTSGASLMVWFVLLLCAACAGTAHADITNTATAIATYNGNPVTSAPSLVAVPVAPSSVLMTVAKSAVVNDGGDGSADPGDTISYTITVTNDGTASLTNVVLDDPLVTLVGPTLTNTPPAGDSSDSILSAGWDVLGPEDILTYTATYSLTPADVTAGQVANTATANATTVPGAPVTASDTETTILNAVSSLSLDKSATLNDGGDGIAHAGDTISYSFLVTNTGTVPQTNVTVSDPLLNMASLPGRAEAATLMAAAAAGADPVVTASTTPFDPVAAFEGEVHMFAPAASEKLARIWPGRTVPQLPTALHVERKLLLLSGDPGFPKAGDRIGIYFDLVNTGNGPLTNITVTQAGAEAFGGSLDILAPNTRDSASIIFTRLLTEKDIVDGLISEPATVWFEARDRSRTFAVSDDLPLAAMSGMEELATAAILPTNVAQLDPGESTTFTATLILTQDHIDDGVVNNTAEATSDDPTVSAPDSVSTPLPAMPGIAIIKEGTINPGVDGIADVGDTITYAFTIRNTGNVTLSDITLNDPVVTVAGGPIASLAPNIVDSTTFTASYAITQADIDAGYFDNQAEATGTAPDGITTANDFSDDDSETENEMTRVDLLPLPEIALIKQLDTSTYPTAVEDVNGNNMNDVGDIVHYTFQIQNTGNVTLSNVNIVDRNPLIAVTPAPPTLVSLAPNQIDTTSFAAQYTLSQADVDAGAFNNTADVYGTDPNDTIVTDESDPGVFTQNAPTVLTVPAQPGIALIKNLDTTTFPTGIEDVNGNNMNDVGDVIHYFFRVENTGNLTLTGITLTDNNAVEAGGPIATLLPGDFDNVTFSASHEITLADMTAGEVVNRAHVSANIPGGGTVEDDSDPTDITENDYTIVPLVAQPAVSLVKRFVELEDTDNSSTVNAGDTIRYDLDVRNTGNVTLTQISINEQPGVTVLGGPTIASLEAGETDTTTFTAEYVLTPADILAGIYSNLAEVVGVAPDLTVVRDDSDESLFDDEAPSNTDDPTLTSLAGAGVALLKQVASIEDWNGDSIDNSDDIIHYTFVITNTGTVPITITSLTDDNGTVISLPGALVLSPGQSNATHFRAEHVIVLADMLAGSVTNTATVNASSSLGPVSDTSHPIDNTANGPTVTALTPAPAIALVKTVADIDDVNGNGLTDPGDLITYSFVVYNTGNTVLSDASVTDLLPGVNLPVTATGAINPGGQVELFGTYTIADTDVGVGFVSNTARVDSPGGLFDISDDTTPGSDSDATVTPVVAAPVVLSKTVAKSVVLRGEQVDYTITASGLFAGPYDITDTMPPGFNFVSGSATVNGVAATPVENGTVLTFAALTPDLISDRIIIKLRLLAPATLSTGSFVNRASVFLSATGQLLGTAKVPVQIKDEHVFDCGEIIGRVFDDLNGNGYADAGEPGMPGVRVATVKGLLVTTDAKGRFHISCADIPNAAIGSNFLMKLDTRTLPADYRLTTENPRDVRLTRGKITKLNFGVSKDRSIELELRRDAFAGGGIALKDTWAEGVDRLVSLLAQGQGRLSIVYRCTQFAPVAEQRLAAVKALVKAKWFAAGHDDSLIIDARVECGQ